MPNVIPFVKIDARNLNRGFELANQYTKKTPEQACNFTAKEVAFGAYENTPVTGAQKIDSEMMKIVAPKIGKRGKPVKGNQFRSGKLINVVRKGKVTGVPLAVLIIQASVRPVSNYNVLTGSRYARTQSPFKGVSREAGRSAMAAAEDAMIKGRRRSASGFIRAGWLKAMKILKLLTPAKYRGRGFSVPSGQNVEALGDVIPAKPNSTNTFTLIENDVGLEGKNAKSQNRALLQYGGPALQLAMDREGKKQMDYFLKKSSAEELEGPVNKVWS